MSNQPLQRNDDEIARIRALADSGHDGPVLMLNLNLYTEAAGFPDGALYRDYMAVLERFLPAVGARILWRQPLHEVLAAWYPSHRAFLDLPTAPGAAENYRLRQLAVKSAVIHRLAGDRYPFAPAGMFQGE